MAQDICGITSSHRPRVRTQVHSAFGGAWECSLAGSSREEKGKSLVESSQYLPPVGTTHIPILP